MTHVFTGWLNELEAFGLKHPTFTIQTLNLMIVPAYLILGILH